MEALEESLKGSVENCLKQYMETILEELCTFDYLKESL